MDSARVGLFVLALALGACDGEPDVDAGSGADAGADAGLDAGGGAPDAGFDGGSDGGPEGVHFVDVDGRGGPCSDDGPGTLEAPWCTLAHAFDVVAPGDTTYVRGGTYVQRAPLGETLPDKNATPTAPIRFVGYPGEEAIVTSMRPERDPSRWSRETGEVYSLAVASTATSTVPNVSQGGSPLRFMGNGEETRLTGEGEWSRSSTHVFVWARGGGNPGLSDVAVAQLLHEGLLPFEPDANEANPMYADTIRINEGNDHFVFESLVLEGGYYPIMIEASGVVLRDCEIRNCFGDAVKARASAEGGLIEGCDIHSFGESGVDVTGGDRWVIRDSAIHHNTANRAFGTKGNGIMLKAGNVGTVVERNLIYALDTSAGALTLGGITNGYPNPEGSELVVRNNVVYDVASTQYCVLFMACRSCSLVNNLFARCAASGAAILITDSDGPAYASADALIANNVFVGVTGSRSVDVTTGSAVGLRTECDLWDEAPTYRLEGAVLSYAEARSAGLEGGSRVATPRFVDAAAGDFRLAPGSPGIDEGCPLPASLIDDDFDGLSRPRGGGWDVGPFER